MNNKPSFKFISYPYECTFGTAVRAQQEHTIMDRDLCLDDVLEQFRYFLLSAGYIIEPGGRLEVVNDSDDYDYRDSLHDEIESLMEENESLMARIKGYRCLLDKLDLIEPPYDAYSEYSNLPERHGIPV